MLRSLGQDRTALLCYSEITVFKMAEKVVKSGFSRGKYYVSTPTQIVKLPNTANLLAITKEITERGVIVEVHYAENFAL